MAAAARPEDWRMAGEESPLFEEYLRLCAAEGWGELMQTGDVQVNEKDVLVVVDMQNDFVPCDARNRDGGRFAVAEGAKVAPLIERLMLAFAAKGAMVVATKDYHPSGHCSFVPAGPFPPHCIQGSVGSRFYEPIGKCMHKLQRLERRAEVVFKGFNEDVDSFGSFQYTDADHTWSRLAHASGSGRLHGCSLCSWTGAVAVKCSNAEEDIDAPPDMMAIFGRERLGDKLRAAGVERVFACGLALDFCVLDTVLNGAKAGFKEVYMVMDAARAAHIPGIGAFGSGFLSSPAETKASLAAAGVRLAPSAALLPAAAAVAAEEGPPGAVRPLAFAEACDELFPKRLGSFAQVHAKELALTLDLSSLTYAASSPKSAIESLTYHGLRPEGKITPLAAVNLTPQQRKDLGIPEEATQFAWAFPIEMGRFPEHAWGYFSITTPGAAFFVFGGFIYTNAAGNVLQADALTVGKGLAFGGAEAWMGKEYSKALEGRWHPVTLPLLRRQGAQLYTWIAPGESIAPQGLGGAAKQFEKGAFAFLFHQDLDAEDARDAYFEVTSLGRPVVDLGHTEDWLGALGETFADFGEAIELEGKKCCKSCAVM